MSRATAFYSMGSELPILVDMWVHGNVLPHPRTPPVDTATFFAVPFDKVHGGASYAVWSFPGQLKLDDALYIGDCPVDSQELLAICFEANGNEYPQAILLY